MINIIRVAIKIAKDIRKIATTVNTILITHVQGKDFKQVQFSLLNMQSIDLSTIIEHIFRIRAIVVTMKTMPKMYMRTNETLCTGVAIIASTM